LAEVAGALRVGVLAVAPYQLVDAAGSEDRRRDHGVVEAPLRRVPQDLRVGQAADVDAGELAEVAVGDQRARSGVDPEPRVDGLDVAVRADGAGGVGRRRVVELALPARSHRGGSPRATDGWRSGDACPAVGGGLLRQVA